MSACLALTFVLFAAQPVATAPTPATPASAPAAPPPVVPRSALPEIEPPKPSRGLLVAGFSIGGVAYLTTSLAGALAIDRARDFTDDPLTEEDESQRGDRRRAFGFALLVPVAGPFVAIPRADTAMRAWAAGISGVAQAAALGLTIAGLVRRSASRRAHRLAFAPIAGPDGA